MRYVIPDYYKEFYCTADQCEDTCCAGWQIVIDRKSLRKYGQVKGRFRKRMFASVDFMQETFRQDKEKRCAFLNENNLCDLYSNLGKRAFAKLADFIRDMWKSLKTFGKFHFPYPVRKWQKC